MSKAAANLALKETALEQVAFELGRDLAEAEIAIDDAISRVAKLMARVPEARQTADLSAVVDQPVFNHMGSSISSLTAGRGELVKAHRVLETLRRELKLPAVSFGDKLPGPAPGPMLSGGLRVVGDHA